MYRKLKSPISVSVEVTDQCDNACLHCYRRWIDMRGANTTSMSLEQVREVVETLAGAEVLDITWTGGEPLLVFDTLLEGLRLAKEKGIKNGLNTNLTSLTPEMARELHRAGIGGILTSLAGPNAAIHDHVVGRKGAFEDTVAGIQVAIAEGIRISANMVVTTVNQDYLWETGLLAYELGCAVFGATRATAPGNCPNFKEKYHISRETVRTHLALLQELEKQTGIRTDIFEHYPSCLLGDLETYAHYARRRCTAGVSAAAVGPDGSIRPCSHNNQGYGNIFDSPVAFINAWDSMEAWRDGSLLSPKCKECKHLLACSGGCRMDALSQGSICEMDSHAIGEAGVKLPKQKLARPQDLPAIMQIDRTIRFRQEEWGACAKVTDGYTSLLNHDGYKIVLGLAELHSFTLDDVCTIFPDLKRENAQAFLRHIIAKRLVHAV